VSFLWPVVFLLAALVGGSLGSTLAELGRKGRAKRTMFIRHFIAGLITGVIVALGFAAGVNLLPVSVVSQLQFNEASVCLVAALGGWLGIGGLKKGLPALRQTLEGA
jgi:EamA domain-containing membrane protein RarD